MDIVELIEELTSCIESYRQGTIGIMKPVSYSNEMVLYDMEVVLENARLLFCSQNAENLDNDIREEVYEKWKNNILFYLDMFPDRELKNSPKRM